MKAAAVQRFDLQFPPYPSIGAGGVDWETNAWVYEEWAKDMFEWFRVNYST
jgi:hypothetical protein